MDIVKANIISRTFVGSCSSNTNTVKRGLPCYMWFLKQTRRMLKNLFLQCTLQCKNDVNWSVIIKKNVTLQKANITFEKTPHQNHDHEFSFTKTSCCLVQFSHFHLNFFSGNRIYNVAQIQRDYRAITSALRLRWLSVVQELPIVVG